MKKTIISIGLIILFILVGFFLLNKKPVTLISTPENTQPVVALVDGRHCYAFNHEATKDAPYTVNEFLDITINGKNVSGTKTGTQSGPDMTNGYTGTITGILEKDTITSVFAYTIEGSSNKEQEIYRAGLTGIEKLRYPLKEAKEMLVPDTTGEVKILTYAQVVCTASN
jgi:hypothetical protein